MHELGQLANGAAEVAVELTKRAVAGDLSKRSATYEGITEDQDNTLTMNYSIGLSAVLVAAAVSALTGVYFEKVLKDSPSPVSVWTRNLQLSFYSLFPSLFIGVVFKDGAEIAKHGFFDGYSGVVWTAIVFQAVGGILASLCINYADNIAKNFATSISIVISFVFSVWFFNFDVTFTVSHPSTCPLNTLRSLLISTIVPLRYNTRPVFNIPLQRTRAKERPAAANQHCQLREDYDRQHPEDDTRGQT